MPLRRDNVTRGQRWMFPVFPGFCIGAVWRCLGAPDVPGLWIEDFLPMHVWAFVFALCAALMITGLVRHDRTLYQAGLMLLALTAALWAAAFFALSVHKHDLGGAFWIWPAFVAATCLGAIRSLEDSREAP